MAGEPACTDKCIPYSCWLLTVCIVACGIEAGITAVDITDVDITVMKEALSACNIHT